MRQTLLTLALVIILLATGFVWFKYIRDQSPEKPSGADEFLSEQRSVERISQYRQIKNLQPDTGIFSDPLFKALRPGGGTTQPEKSAPPPAKAGRSNPFAF